MFGMMDSKALESASVRNFENLLVSLGSTLLLLRIEGILTQENGKTVKNCFFEHMTQEKEPQIIDSKQALESILGASILGALAMLGQEVEEEEETQLAQDVINFLGAAVEKQPQKDGKQCKALIFKKGAGFLLIYQNGDDESTMSATPCNLFDVLKIDELLQYIAEHQ